MKEKDPILVVLYARQVIPHSVCIRTQRPKMEIFPSKSKKTFSTGSLSQFSVDGVL